MPLGYPIIRSLTKTVGDPYEDDFAPHSELESDGKFSAYVIDKGLRIYIKYDYNNRQSARYNAQKLGIALRKTYAEEINEANKITKENNPRLNPKYGDLLFGPKGGAKLVGGMYTPKEGHKYAGILCVMVLNSGMRVQVEPLANYRKWAKQSRIINVGVEL